MGASGVGARNRAHVLGYLRRRSPCTIVYAYSTPTPYAPQCVFTMSMTAS